MEIISQVDWEFEELTSTLRFKKEKKIYFKNIKNTKRLTFLFTMSALLTGNLMCINSFIQSLLYKPHIIINEMVCNFTCNFRNGDMDVYVNILIIKNIFQGQNVTSTPPAILRSWFPFNDIWNHFTIVYIVQFTAMWIGMIFVPGWHCFIVSLKVHAIIRIELLDYRLKHLQVITRYMIQFVKSQ